MTTGLDSIIEEMSSKVLPDAARTLEELVGRKPKQLASPEQIHYFDYMFRNGLYPISEDRDYQELGGMYSEEL